MYIYVNKRFNIMKLRKLHLVSLSLLAIWFVLVFFDVYPLTLDGTISLISPYGLLLLFLVISLVGISFKWAMANVFTFFYTGYWLYLQWGAHWKMVILGASEDRVAYYNDFFHGTMRLFSESSVQIVPDLYHTVLGVLILITFVLTIVKILNFIR